MTPRPISRLDFWEQHPLPKQFMDVYDRLMDGHQDKNQQYLDQLQWDAVTQAIERDYVRYLRRWARAHTP